MKRITLAHGSGGALTNQLIKEVFSKYFSIPELDDASYIDVFGSKDTAVTTDSFVVSPIFFPGGDIGKLSICGTLNDLAVSGAKPVAMTCGFILEEGLPLDELEGIVSSMAGECESAEVKIVAGDTKVVPKGKGDKLFINTTGIGRVERKFSPYSVKPGDLVVVTGSVGEHGLSILLAREALDVDVEILSDCANLYPMLEELFSVSGVRWMRDATRGGLATVCLDLSDMTGLGIKLYEKKIPVKEEVSFLCDMLGFDPLYLANEGKAVVVVSKEDADQVLNILKSHPLGKDAEIIGEVVDKFAGVVLKTSIGGERVLDYMEEDPLPRIC
ncbi:hydrogenase expression/formation protein HypE [Thermosulfidibacter takaii]